MQGAAAQVRGDPDQLAQVIGNLLQNAIRYTPAGGKVRTERVGGFVIEATTNTPTSRPATLTLSGASVTLS